MHTASAKFWKARLAAGLLLLAGPISSVVAASPALEQALLIQAEELARLHAGMQSCPDIPVAADAAQAWDQSKAILVATLWANAVSSATVNTIKASLDAVPAAPDCADERLRGSVEHMAADWVGRISYQLGQLGFAVIANPPQAADWEAVRAIVAEQTPAQARMLACMSVRDPLFLPDEVNRWDGEIAQVGLLLAGRGFDRDEVSRLLTPAMAGAIWQPAAGDAVAALQADCDADTKWSDDLALFNVPRILAPVEALLQ